MTHPTWPLFDLRVLTPRLELRYIDDELATELALLALKGIHDPETMPFAFPWTDVESPQREYNTLQFYWRCRAEIAPKGWTINLATIVDGVVVGTSALIAHDFPALRQFETGSWLGREYQGQGLGKEMRSASLHLGFLGFGAESATTSAWHDNAPSLGVTRSLGYEANGHKRMLRRADSDTLALFELSRPDFLTRVQRGDITLHGVAECLPLLGLDAGTANQ